MIDNDSNSGNQIDLLKNCPKCDCIVGWDTTECPKCGIVFEKYTAYIEKKNSKNSESKKRKRKQPKEISFSKGTFIVLGLIILFFICLIFKIIGLFAYLICLYIFIKHGNYFKKQKIIIVTTAFAITIGIWLLISIAITMSLQNDFSTLKTHKPSKTTRSDDYDYTYCKSIKKTYRRYLRECNAEQDYECNIAEMLKKRNPQCFSSSKTYTKSYDSVDSLPGVSSAELISLCKKACAYSAPIGSDGYNECVYCCTHECE
jgi:hypothetical protein